jgi:hypothetical protein
MKRLLLVERKSMIIARKLASNLGWRALLVLGPSVYLRYLFAFFRNLPAILRAGDFKPLDRAMGARPIKARMNGREFVIDCPYTDQRIVDGTFTFGIMREMYIRNCYLRYGVSQAASKARIVLDLGANRGAFSVMMACRAKLVIAVEFNPLFKDVIAHNMIVNGFTNYEIETVFIGEGGMGDDGKSCRMTIPDLLQKHDIESFDLVKMDIEGSEFALFRSPEWLTRVSAVCMEVHPDYGEPQEILAALERHAFDVVVTDVMFRPVEDLKHAGFIYAWKSRSEPKR